MEIAVQSDRSGARTQTSFLTRLEERPVCQREIEAFGAVIQLEGRPAFVSAWSDALSQIDGMVSPSKARPRSRFRVLDGEALHDRAEALECSEIPTAVIASYLTNELLRLAWCERCRVIPPPEGSLDLREACAEIARHFVGVTRAESILRLSKEVSFEATSGLLASGESRHVLGGGELCLLRFLLERPNQWRSIVEICAKAFLRTDDTARKLVWKYASMIRKKLGSNQGVLENSRRHGYRIVIGAATV